MKKFVVFLIVCSTFFINNAQSLEPYRIYNTEGHVVTFEEMAEYLSSTKVVLFGELHDNPISHWLQLELTHFFFKKFENQLVLGAEMFETDNQLILDEYLRGLISQGRFEAEARIWPNYKTDYKPLIEFAKENKLRFIATNIPRRYASMVASGGFDALEKLTDKAKEYIAPLPIDYDPELPGYKAMLEMAGMPGRHGVSPDNFPKAQAVKDATMAWNISRNYLEGNIFLHFHGTYHSNNYEGIVWYLNRYLPNVKMGTIATVLQDNMETLEDENFGLADYIIVVTKRMTRTY